MPENEALEITTDDDASRVNDRTTAAWRQFELDVVKTIRNLDPAARVLHDQKVTGIVSGTERQLDAVATKAVAGADIEMVIECKQYARKLGIGKIDEFVGKLIDAGCSHGILYATSGVTAPARRRAESSRNPKITLRDLSDVTDFTGPTSRSYVEVETFLEANAVDFSGLIEEVVFGNCQADNCWYGEVGFGELNGIDVGRCSSCGQFHIRCKCCDEVTEADESHPVCYVCGAEYNVRSHKGDVDGIEQLTHGPDCEGGHSPSEESASDISES